MKYYRYNIKLSAEQHRKLKSAFKGTDISLSKLALNELYRVSNNPNLYAHLAELNKIKISGSLKLVVSLREDKLTLLNSIHPFIAAYLNNEFINVLINNAIKSGLEMKKSPSPYAHMKLEMPAGFLAKAGEIMNKIKIDLDTLIEGALLEFIHHPYKTLDDIGIGFMHPEVINLRIRRSLINMVESSNSNFLFFAGRKQMVRIALLKFLELFDYVD